MAQSEIDAIRVQLGSKPRPIGWSERRQRLDEVGSIWPVADDVKLSAVDAGGAPGEWSSVPGCDNTRVLMFFHGGGYCSGSIRSHRRMVSEAGRAAAVRTLAIGYRLAPEHPYPAAPDDALAAWHFLRREGIAAAHIAIGGDSAGGGLTIALINRLRAAGEDAARLRVAGVAVDRSDNVRFDPRDQGRHRPTDSQSLSRGTCRRLRSGRNGSHRPARLATPFRSRRISADAHSGRISGNAACRCDAFCCRRRCGGCRGDAGDLAAHDSRVASVERASGRCHARARPRRRIYPRASVTWETSRCARILCRQRPRTPASSRRGFRSDSPASRRDACLRKANRAASDKSGG